jgi:FMN phosphatase YigB (HAD superfamily)
MARLKKSGYLKYFKDLFVSDRIGIEKPEKGFFDTCLGKMGYEADQVIIIGDGILSDISGGINAGMNTCWYNRKRERGPEGIVPQYEITAFGRTVELYYEIQIWIAPTEVPVDSLLALLLEAGDIE